MNPPRTYSATTEHLAREAAAGRISLPSVPRVVRTLITQLRDPNISVHTLISELEQEPQLAARVLRMANTPYYSGRRNVANLNEAVSVIGLRALQTLVISGGLEAVFVTVPGVNLRRFWLDASLTGHAARTVARLGEQDAETAFLAGLLHQVGHIILCQAYPDTLGERLSSSDAPRSAELMALERELCGTDHAEVSAYWMDVLGFPHNLIQAVADQARPLDSAEPLAAILALAKEMVAAVEDGDAPKAIVARLDAALLRAAALTEDDLQDDFETQLEWLHTEWGGA